MLAVDCNVRSDKYLFVLHFPRIIITLYCCSELPLHLSCLLKDVRACWGHETLLEGRRLPGQYQNVFGPTTAAVGPSTAVRGLAAAVVGPGTFAYVGLRSDVINYSR